MNTVIPHLWWFLITYLTIVAPGGVKSYYVTVNIDYNHQGSGFTYMVTNKPTNDLCPLGYRKYMAERNDYFSVGSVRNGEESIKIDGSDIVLHYVYAVESYWKENTPIMVRFTKYHGWYTRVYPAYVLTSSGEWKEENTYYWERKLITGNLGIVLDNVAYDVRAFIERDKGKATHPELEADETPEREFKLFEEDQVKKKKSGFVVNRASSLLLLIMASHTLLSV